MVRLCKEICGALARLCILNVVKGVTGKLMKLQNKFASLALFASALAAGCASEGGASSPAGGQSTESVVDGGVIATAGFVFSPELQAAIDEARAACGCFGDVRAVQVAAGTPAADVFSSDDVLAGLFERDVELGWREGRAADVSVLETLLGDGGALLAQIGGEAQPAGGVVSLGLRSWSRETAPDFCSGETAYLAYFEASGVVVAFRVDSSSEC
jgi:hypothetical protein